MLEAFNASNAVQPSNRTCARQAGGEAYTLSRNPLLSEQEPFTNSVESTRPATDTQLERIREATRHDAQLQKVTDVTLKGWPAGVEDVAYQIREFFDSREHMSISDALLTYDDCIVIPASMREEILEGIHRGHQGITKCRERTNLSVWWPGISKEIKSKVRLCHFCQENKSSQREEPLRFV